MTTPEQDMSSEQSLRIIHDMINKARFNFSRGSFYFILWGVLLIGASIFEYAMQHVLEGDLFYLGWPVVGIAGGIASAVYGARSSKGETMTHLDRVYSGIWMAFFATLILFIIGAVSLKMNPGSYIMILTGLPTFLTGFVLRFRPLIFGGIGFWVLGLMSLYVFQDYGQLIFALSILQGYLIPGILMRNMKNSDV